MPSDERPGRRGADLTLTIGVLIAVFAALLPLMRVVRPSSWLIGAIVLAVAVLAAGYIARRYRLPALAVSLIEASVWVGFMMLVFLRDTAFLLIVPTPETIRALPGLISLASEQIALGAAPLDAGLALSLLIVGGTGLLTIIVDHVVLTARMPLLAAIGLIAVSLIPSIAVPGEVDIMAFVLLAAAILFLMRTDTRSREEPMAREATRTAGVPATALGIGAIAVVVALVAVPLLPEPIARAGAGSVGAGPGIDATLQLGDDLRRPREVEVLLVRSSAPSAPYLRATTLSQLEGDVWEPDRVRTVALENELALGGVPVDEDIRVTEYVTTVEVLNLASPWLPVPYPAVAVNGLEGQWSGAPYNRTVLARSATTQGQNYEVVTNVPRPTLEQIRAATAGGTDQREGTTAVPDDISPIVGDLAAEVTAETTNDYDALVALQSWFRSTEFAYSLDAPVEEGFDGSGTDAVARFLQVREGYCIHFASAFALMARTLSMPSRIVVGYLPGSATSDAVERETVYSVSSGQLHAWPEVYFEGIGWIPFEPTNSLGVPTAFSPAGAAPGGVDEGTDPSPLPSASASPGAGLTPDEADTGQDGAQAGGTATTVNPLPALGVVLGILFALAIPALIRELRRRQMLTSARAGDAAAAWQTVQDVAIDLGIDVPASETPRSLGTRLVEQHGAPAAEMSLLISAIERASYAPGGKHGFWQGDAIADAATAVRVAMLADVETPRRLLALLAPRSLVVRPGSVYAGSGATARAR
jgi:transglutaminase-like putative cysteine protease